MTDFPMIKYPRTPHIQGSRLQFGDEDLSQIPFASIAGVPLVVEEKCDGANSAVSFDRDGSLRLQSRGHYLNGGAREKHYQLLKTWATTHQAALWQALGSRYLLFGEWMYPKHTVFYNALPHYFLEFDLLDRESGLFLDTPSRRRVLAGLPIVSAPVLAERPFASLAQLTALIGPSRFIRPGHMTELRALCLRMGDDADKRCAETDPTGLMEGLYIKIEQGGYVRERMKFVRAAFLQCIDFGETNWLDKMILPNQLACPLEALFEPRLPRKEGC